MWFNQENLVGNKLWQITPTAVVNIGTFINAVFMQREAIIVIIILTNIPQNVNLFLLNENGDIFYNYR